MPQEGVKYFVFLEHVHLENSPLKVLGKGGGKVVDPSVTLKPTNQRASYESFILVRNTRHLSCNFKPLPLLTLCQKATNRDPDNDPCLKL